MKSGRRRTDSWHYSTATAVPVLAAAFAAIMLAAIVLRWTTQRLDAMSELSQRQAVQYAIDSFGTDIAKQQEQALQAADRRDSSETVARRLATLHRHDAVFVLSPDRQLTAAWLGGREIENPATPAFAELLGAIRTGDAADPAVQFLNLSDRIAVASVVADRRSRSTIVSARFLDDDFLRDAAVRGSLGAIEVVPSQQSAGSQSLELTGPDGKPLAQLVWRGHRPGTQLLTAFWPVAAVAALAAVLVMSLLVRHLDRTTAELKKREAEARIRALHDQLTELPNREFFNQRLGEAVAQVRAGKDEIAVLALDLDRFKQVNDTLGHPAGDQLLREFSTRLRRVVRASDVTARIGGDEFLIVQHDVRRDRDSIALCERILKAAREPFDLNGAQAFVDVSIGVVRASAGDDPADLIRKADIALYEAKGQGRACYRLFDNSMDDRVRARRTFEADLRAAIETGDGLHLVYQPMVAARSGATVGAEALLRWEHPEKGAVSPADFIPIAEEIGLIGELGDRVLRDACATALRLPTLNVAVNLSPVQFRDPCLPERLLAIVEEYRVDPKRIELEITEAVFLGGAQAAGELLKRLRGHGFRIALDDFGTGYSSLSHLTRYHFDRIKIDRSFVHRLDTSSEAVAVVQAVVALGRSLGVTIIAEGVETAEQRSFLVEAGVHQMQGFLFAAPAPSDELARRVAAETPQPAVA